MELNSLLTLDAISLTCDAESMKQAICCIARHASHRYGLDSNDVIEVLLEREKLGSTGIGDGIALPHAMVPGLTEKALVFLRLSQAVDFDALDDQPVDLVCALLVPEAGCQDHKKCLAKLARVLRDPQVSARVRQAGSKEAVLAALTKGQSQGHNQGHNQSNSPTSEAA